MADNDKTIGGRRNRNNNTGDVHSTGRAVRGNSDVHSTGKAARGGSDVHSTGKAARGGDAARPFEQRGMRAGTSAAAKASGAAGWPDEFVFDGLKYKNEGILSDTSGEALVFTLTRGGKKYALKLYYYDPDHRPDHKILEKIKKLGSSGLVVNIVSHGEWENPSAPGEKNDYELMEFCEGGSLDNVILEGDEKALAQVAVSMGAAIDFLSKHGILHRDIKPGNFFYADKAKTRIVLADFGISAECPVGGTCKIDEMRSPVYAAPEFYTNVPGEPAEVGVESDFFSLGMSLLCLWLGKAKLTAKEGQLLKAKMNEALPMPKDMSEHTRSLIRALTRLKMADRATFDDIKRWAKGESLDTGTASDVHSDFHVVFNSATNKIANSPAELARLLVEDMPLGKKYLYSGRVTRWLEETNRNELAVNVEEIVEDIYPGNQRAGLMATAYMLDPSMDYAAPDGNHYSDPAEISQLILCNNAEMSSEITDPESDFMIYLRALRLDKTVDTITEYVQSDAYKVDDSEQGELLNSFVACQYLALLIDPSKPLFISSDGGWTEADSVDDVLEELHKAEDINFINYAIIGSPAFIVWLSARNPALAGKVRMLHDKAVDDDIESLYYLSDSPYRIVYELDAAVDFNFGTDPDAPDRIYTIPQVGGYLNERLNEMQQGDSSTDDFAALFVNMEGNPVGHYLRARGESYFHFLKYNIFCMDIDNEDNKQKAGDYDYVIAAYKSVAAFLGHAPYYTIDGRQISELSELKKLPGKDVAAEIGGKVREMPKDGKTVPWLDAWIYVFFQENPALDLSKQFTYEKEAAKAIEFIASIDPKNYFALRYDSAIKDIDKAAGELKRSEGSTKGWRNFFLIACLVPSLIAIIGGLVCGTPDFNPIIGHYWPAFGLIFVGVCFYSTVDWSFGTGLWHGLIAAAVGPWILRLLFGWSPGIVYAALGIALIVSAVIFGKYLLERDKVDTGGKQIRGDEFEYRQLDALYFAYHQQDGQLDNVIKKYASMQQSLDDTTRKNIRWYGWKWFAIAWSIFFFWYFCTPEISGKRTWVTDYAALEQQLKDKLFGTWTGVYEDGSTKIVCRIDSLVDKKEIFGTMIIAGQKPVAAKGEIKVKRDTIVKEIFFKPADMTSYHQVFKMRYDPYTDTRTGYYVDRKGTSHDIIITPPSGTEPTTPTPVPAPSKPKKKAEKKAEPEPAPVAVPVDEQEAAPEATQEVAPESVPESVPEAEESVLCHDTLE